LSLSGRQRVVLLLNSNGIPHAFQVSINSYDKNDYIVSFSDISDSMVEKLELKKEMTLDHLTQVYNRVYFYKYIEEILATHKRHKMLTGILFFDIDHFKSFNYTYGHDR
jgi:GGDEF domain-containing protein